jgi:hypothetical protein
MVAGCLVYGFDGSDEWHKTSYYLWLTRAKPEVLSDGSVTEAFDLTKPHKFETPDLSTVDQVIGKFAN